MREEDPPDEEEIPQDDIEYELDDELIEAMLEAFENDD
jgi:hypothetical protein